MAWFLRCLQEGSQFNVQGWCPLTELLGHRRFQRVSLEKAKAVVRTNINHRDQRRFEYCVHQGLELIRSIEKRRHDLQPYSHATDDSACGDTIWTCPRNDIHDVKGDYVATDGYFDNEVSMGMYVRC